MADKLKIKTETFDVEKIRQDFPILSRKVKGKQLIYFDNAATTQKPLSVVQTLENYYKRYNANVHRGIHTLSEEATLAQETARVKIAEFINAKSAKEIIFVRNATEALNLIVYSWAFENLKKGDEVISSVMEHHSNIVPWQFLQRKGIKLKFVDINGDGTLKFEQYEDLITSRTKVITVTHASNVLGTINPVKDIGKLAHDNNCLFVVDGAQSVPHMPVDAQDINCDFLVFSGHKMLGPTGIGVLHGKRDILESMPPFLGGGDMIKEVRLFETRFNELPWKFEAGTPNIAGAIGLGAAVDYLNKVGRDEIRKHEKDLVRYTLERLTGVKDIELYGPQDVEKRGGVVSFNLGDIHPHDLATILDEDAIAIRSGHHCAQPLMERLGIVAASRASFYLYNTKEEVDVFIESLQRARKVFKL